MTDSNQICQSNTAITYAKHKLTGLKTIRNEADPEGSISQTSGTTVKTLAAPVWHRRIEFSLPAQNKLHEYNKFTFKDAYFAMKRHNDFHFSVLYSKYYNKPYYSSNCM